MAVENYFLSREGRILVNKILKFMRSLIIKIDREANLEETKESYLAWLGYKYAYEGTDDVYSYGYDLNTFIKAGIPTSVAQAKHMLDKEKCFKLCLNNDSDALKLLRYLRNERISSYKETNGFYYQFLGLPREGQEIRIKNRDGTNPEFLFLHEIDIINHSKTYEYVYVEGVLDTIRKDHPEYYYIRYLGEKKSLYLVRNTEQFDIIDYDNTILSEHELSTFFDIYNRKKIYMQKMMYVDGFNSRMELYPFLMEVLLLQDVFMSFFNSFMDNFALANYNEQEIFDLLDSYNLSSLKKVKMSTLKKIIRDIPDLMELRGSDLIIEKILDIVSDDSVTIKRYYLQKEYMINAAGETIYDTNKTYEKNVNLVFKEKIIRAGNSDNVENINDYDVFVRDDDLWGGELEGVTQDVKDKAKTKLKNELLKLDFSQILTKYLTISSTVNTHDKQFKLQNYLGLFWQFIRNNRQNNFLAMDEVSFENFNVKAIDLYAAICWFYQYLNGMNEPATIVVKNMNIANIMALRDSGIGALEDITGNKLDVSNPDYKPPATIRMPKEFGKKTVIEVLGAHDNTNKNQNPKDDLWPFYQNPDGSISINYESTIVTFPGVITLQDLFKNYNKNAAIIAALRKKWIETASLTEARAWEYLIAQNHTHTFFEVIFDTKTRYDHMIKESNNEFYNYLSLVIDNENVVNKYDNVYQLYMRLLDAFKMYIQDKTENVIILPSSETDSSEASMSYLTDLKLLFNEFLSIYTELHKIEYSQTLDDAPFNKIRLLYYYNKDTITDEFTDKTYIDDKPKVDTVETIEDGTMMKHNQVNQLIKRIEELDIPHTEQTLNLLKDKMILPLEKDNMQSYITEWIQKLEDIRSRSIGGLSGENKDFYDVYKEIDTLLKDPTVKYGDILNIIKGTKRGIDVFININTKEIESLKDILNHIKKKKDYLPKYRHYIEDYLLEYYVERIILIHKIMSDLLWYDVTDKVYLGEQLKYITDYLYDDYKEKLEVHHFLDLRDEHITLLFYEVLKIVKYQRMADEITITTSDTLKQDFKQLSSYIENHYKDNLKIIHLLDLRDEHITELLRDTIKIGKYKRLADEITIYESIYTRLNHKITNDIKETHHKTKIGLYHKFIEQSA